MAKVSLKQLFTDYLIQLKKEKAAIENELHTLSDKRSVFAKDCVIWHNENDGKIEFQQRQIESIRQSLTGWKLETSIYDKLENSLQYANPASALIQRSNYEFETIKGFDLEEQAITRRLKEKQREIDVVVDNFNCIFLFKKEEYAIWRGDE